MKLCALGILSIILSQVLPRTFFRNRQNLPNPPKPHSASKPIAEAGGFGFREALRWAYLLTNFYTGHLSLYSTELIQQAGGFRLGVNGSQDHDLALRLSERVNRDQVVLDIELEYRKRFRRQWAKTVRFDLYYNPNLSRKRNLSREETLSDPLMEKRAVPLLEAV